MNSVERVKSICKVRKIPISKLEKDLGFSNAYIAQLRKGTFPADRLRKIANYLGVSDEYLLTGEEAPLANILPMPETRKIPLLGAIACGEPILAVENIEDYVNIPKQLAGDFALRCKGDSMINARIFDGDLVYIRQQDTVDSGQIAAVLIGSEATLKRVLIYPDHIVLEPENPMYKPLAFWHEEMNEIRILGKAVAFTSAVR